MVGRVLLTFLLIITPKARVILVIFMGKYRKNDADLSPTFTNLKMFSLYKLFGQMNTR